MVPGNESAFAVKIKNCIEALKLLDSATGCNTFKEKTLETATLAIRAQPWSNRSTVSVETLSIIKKRRVVRLAGDERHPKKLEKSAQLQVDRERVTSKPARETEESFN